MFFNKNSKEHWIKYYGKENTEKLLFQKSQSLVAIFPDIVMSDSKGVKLIFDLFDVQLSDKKLLELYTEVFYFDLHRISRISQDCLSKEQSSTFFGFFTEALNNVVRTFVDGEEALQKFLDDYNKFEIEYSKYTDQPSEEGILKNVLSREFAERLAKKFSMGSNEGFVNGTTLYFIQPTVLFRQIPELLVGRRVRSR